jgi:hypothetical protein
MKPYLLIPLLIGLHLPLSASEDDTPAIVSAGKKYAERLNALHYLGPGQNAATGAAPELNMHHQRRAEAIKFGIQKAIQMARLIESGRQFCAEIQEWSYDSQRERFHITMQLLWKPHHAPDLTSGLQGVLNIQSDGSDPSFILTRQIEPAEPRPSKTQPVFSWPLALR